MALINQGGKLLLQNGALASGSGCCCNKCSGPCDESNPCPEGCACVDGECVTPPCSGPCDESNPCPEGCACVDGECVPASGGACCCCVETLAFMFLPATTEALALFFCQIQYNSLINQGVTPCKECRAFATPATPISPFGASYGVPFCVPSSGGAEDCDCVSQWPGGLSHELISFAPNEPCGEPTAAGYSLCNSPNPLP